MHAKDVKWPWTHNDQRTLYTGIVNTYPCGPNIGHFRSTSSRFRGTRLSKIGIMLNDLRKTTNTLLWKVPCAHYINTYPLGPKFRSVCSATSRFWDTRMSKIEKKRRKCKDWSQTAVEHITENVPYMRALGTYPWGPSFGPFCSIASHFPLKDVLWNFQSHLIPC